MPEPGKILRGRIIRGRRARRDDSDLARNPNQIIVSVARPALLGNPWRIPEDGSREEVIEKYRRMLSYLEPYHKIIRRLEYLRREHLAGKEIVLLCYCQADEPCHADVIREYLERGEL